MKQLAAVFGGAYRVGIALQHGLGNKDAAGNVNDKGVVKFRKVEIKKL